MNELNVLVVLRAKPGREDRLRGNLVGLVEPSRAEAGNLRYDLYQDADDKGRFVFIERWASPEHQQHHHNKGPHIQSFHDDGDEDIESRDIVMTLERLA
ncbi:MULTISPECIES: putative quinol monooxygenase [unclassified Stenotrophomonas]|uniref:putative quinol monooxygenase n=1 Tax=unclassified Stenotrophomonas TaxID=196198 RepID=UPI000D177AB8|nr:MULTISPECIES: putative quinol monooxygenase [unclassified Stenotrophomonas]PTA70683.1 antibiotic biosynthesis monooxygenase [Stenotrophomonas sp. Nf1]PTA81249.1 antibiotic biosynthesis monooxygenase [Stenotrophomonas sp. Nf4]